MRLFFWNAKHKPHVAQPHGAAGLQPSAGDHCGSSLLITVDVRSQSGIRLDGGTIRVDFVR